MSTQSFGALGVPSHLVSKLAAQGIDEPTPIQAATLPDSLAGRDVLGRGRTGSGKTFAFLLPLVARLERSTSKRSAKHARALILAPTRELATQIEASLTLLVGQSSLTSRTIFGGVNQKPQVSALSRGVDVIIACPGRLEDLIAQGHISLDEVEITVIDEADHMADLGFLPAVRRLLSQTPSDSQRMLFSATLDKAVDTLVKQFMHDPVVHEADSSQSVVPNLKHHVLHVSGDQHLPVLIDLASSPGRSVVFTRTKHRARKIARQLNAAGVPSVELQGNMSQSARERSMAAFHAGTAQTLVATDVAARGIHVDDVSLVIHADPPVEHKAYTHRSGRTARAGAEGTVVTLMLDEQRRDVQNLTRKAGVTATVTKVDSKHPMLQQIAPGERELPGGMVVATPNQSQGGSRRGNNSRPKSTRDGVSRPQRSQSQRSGNRATSTDGTSAATSGGAAKFSAVSGAARRRSRG